MKKFIVAFILGFVFFNTSFVLAGPNDTAYFNQFLFRKDSTSNDPDFPKYTYRYLMTHYKAMYQRADGIYVNPWISLLLLADGKFWMEYRENYLNNPDDLQFTPGPCKIIEGSWSVPTTLIQVGDLILGDRAVVNGTNAIKVKFTKDIVSPGLMTAEFDMSLGSSDDDPRQSPMCW